MLLFSCTINAQSEFFSGLATRDQNPLLIGFFVPHTLPNRIKATEITTQISISNTLQKETTNSEQLVIDAESYRLDINIAYPLSIGSLHVQLPIIAHQAGGLDSLIYNWHDFFGLPQGYRNNTQQNQFLLQYTNNSKNIIQRNTSLSGVGDISVNYSYPLVETTQSNLTINTGFNLPTGQDLLSNKQIDWANWLSYYLSTPSQSAYFLSFGFIQNGQAGIFSELIKKVTLFAQAGLNWPLYTNTALILQADYHSGFIKNTDTQALGQSLQLQTGLAFRLDHKKRLNVFFSEDILVGSAPDITFAASLQQQF